MIKNLVKTRETRASCCLWGRGKGREVRLEGAARREVGGTVSGSARLPEGINRIRTRIFFSREDHAWEPIGWESIPFGRRGQRASIHKRAAGKVHLGTSELPIDFQTRLASCFVPSSSLFPFPLN